MHKEIEYDFYDSNGNLVQYTLEPDAAGSGRTVTVIWGYNKTQPIAKIEDATYAQVSSYITDIVNYSIADANPPPDTTPEQAELDLIDRLDAFRKTAQLSGFQFTTYTYDPLIGVTSVTPPSGIRKIYISDTANRLKEIKDINENILKEFKYKYKQ